jgi:TRAP-type mannitol/chloroaromatic compound transport system substrate-binding protein
MPLIQDEGVEIRVLSGEVQQAIIEESDKFLDKTAAEDPFFAKVLQSQRDFLKGYSSLKEVVQPPIGR